MIYIVISDFYTDPQITEFDSLLKAIDFSDKNNGHVFKCLHKPTKKQQYTKNEIDDDV